MISRLWYATGSRTHPLLWPLIPLSWPYRQLAVRRRSRYLNGARPAYRAPVPVVVVGNLSVGGTGKTPLVIWLAEYLRGIGRRPGIVSRGYGGDAEDWPRLVSPVSNPEEVGDEPVLVARRTRMPVVCDPDRPRAIRRLLEYGVDIVISDDGMQHYAMQRDLEIAVVDASRVLGNGRCLPAGPLREPLERLNDVQAVVFNGERKQLPVARQVPTAEMLFEAGRMRRLRDGLEQPIGDWSGRRAHAIAGIGNPERFFASLRRFGIDIIPHAFRDHHRFRHGDLEFGDDLPIVMTEKDAVKCVRLQAENHWCVPVSARLEPASANLIDSLIKGMLRGFEAA